MPKEAPDDDIATLINAWIAEVEAEAADARELCAQAQADEWANRLASRAAFAEISEALLKPAGFTRAQIRSLADAQFARATATADLQRKHAVDVVNERVQAHSAAIKNLLEETNKDAVRLVLTSTS